MPQQQSKPYVQIGWRYRHDPENWAIRNLMQIDPVPVDDWEPVFAVRDNDPPTEAYWGRMRELETQIKMANESIVSWYKKPKEPSPYIVNLLKTDRDGS